MLFVTRLTSAFSPGFLAGVGNVLALSYWSFACWKRTVRTVGVSLCLFLEKGILQGIDLGKEFSVFGGAVF